jgi:hypothetical protein
VTYILKLNDTSVGARAPQFWLNVHESTIDSLLSVEGILSKDNIRWEVMTGDKILDIYNCEFGPDVFSVLIFDKEDDAMLFKLKWS